MANENEQKSFWKEKCIGRIPTTIPALYDTDIHNVEDGQVLKYNAITEKWENGAGGGSGSVGNGMITLTQGGNNKGSFTVNQSGDTIIDLDAGLSIGEVVGTAYEGSKGKSVADRVTALESSTVSKVLAPVENNIAVLTAEGGVNDSGTSLLNVVLKQATPGLLKSDGTVDTDEKALDQDLHDETIRATNAESALNTAKIDKVTNAVSGNLAVFNANGSIYDTGYSTAFLQDLQRKINDIYSRIAGFSVSLNPSSVVVGSHTDVDVTVTCASIPDVVKIYRQSDLVNPAFTDSNPQGTVVTFRDTTVVPNTVGTYKYKTVVTVGAEDNTVESDLTVTKIPVTLTWSANSATAYIGAGEANHFPTISPSTPLPSGSVTYRTSPAESPVATVNASTGVVTLLSTGYVNIIADYAGDATHTYATTSYNLHVMNDFVSSLTWTGYSLNPSSPNAGTQATLTKGMVKANYTSGKPSLDVTDHPSTLYSAVRGEVSGTTYNAPNSAGDDYIKVTYGGKEARFKIDVVSTIYAYIGAGTSVSAVAVDANKTLAYGSGSHDYTVIATTDGDNIYILLPQGTPYIGVTAGGQPAAIENGGTTLISGTTYVIRYVDSVYAGTYNITVNYTN